MSDQPEPLGRLTDAIKDLAARNDLAAVILHLNDTYQIEARPPDIPGMARVATAVECVRNLVRTLTGEDRTLVVHAGDFLSPSYMTTRLGFAGKQVVELLNCCGVDYATIGNHEFDVTPDQLKERLDEAPFPILCANLTAPPTLPQLVTIEYWPRERPFLALSGLAGRQTIKKAIGPRFGFQETGWEDALKRVLEEVQARQEIGAFVLLTHMDRDEDKDTQNTLRLYWAKNGAAFVLGGHDHDISWQEPGANSILCKNLSNCRTLTAVVLSKSAVAAPAQFPPYRYRDIQDTIEYIASIKPWDSRSLPPGAASYQEIVDRTLATWRGTAPLGLRPDFKDAFTERLKQAIAAMRPAFVEEEDYLQGAEQYIFRRAAAGELDRFLYAGRDSGVLTLNGRSEIGQLVPQSEAQQAIDRWVREMETRSAPGGDRVLIDFSQHLPAGDRLNGQDEAMRSRSTDFGNFAADAVELATGADLAMLNAGCFRLDDMVGPSITLRDLQETFLYDRRDAIVVVELTADEVRAMCGHAQQKTGQGAFLQVSRAFESISARTGSLRVAIVRHMIADDEDGFQSLLASSRGWTRDEVPQRLTSVGASGGLIDLVSRGAGSGVVYSAASRLSGTTPDERRARDAFARCVERYQAVCRTVASARSPLELLEFNPLREPIPSRVGYERLLLRALTTQLALIFGLQWVRDELYGDFIRSDLQYRRGIEYDRYLDKAMTYLDFHIIGPRLRDEEGQGELPDAGIIALNIRPRYATNTLFADAGQPARLFADRVDAYVAECRAHNVAYPECKRLIEADPSRAPLARPIGDARWSLRYALLIIAVDLGLERLRTELSAELRELNGRDGRDIRYDEYLESALTYLDIFARYGLLANEEPDSPATAPD
jgi:2',3'-cyclic-nucleotide 2'-phosphodiesterase (5'-nucleotidase family)